MMKSFYFRCGLRVQTLNTAVERGKANSVFAPWAVSIGYYKDGAFQHGCTGSVIAERVILTAAHCTLRKEPLPELTIVRAGVTDLRFSGFTDLEIRETIAHPDYNPEQSYNDIALVFLKTCLTFSYNTIQPICLPSESLQNPNNLGRFGTTVTTQGFGLNSDNEVGKSITEIGVTVRPKEECNTKYQSVTGLAKKLGIELALPNLFNEPVIFCADHTTNGNIGTCKGDSGGPSFRRLEPDNILQYLVIPNISRIFLPEDQSFRFTIEGVTSGNADGADCQGTLPDFYTFVAQEKVIVRNFLSHSL